MEKSLAYLMPDTHNGAFYRAVLAVHQQNYDKANQLINFCRTLHDDELTAMASESYERAYNGIVTMQMLAELEEAMQYQLVPERRHAIKNIWFQRLQSNQRVVDDWHRILLVRSLVLKPQDDLQAWLEFAGMCRKNNRFYQAKKTLVTILGMDPEENPEKSLPHDQPKAAYEYAKFIHTQPDGKMKAYGLLQKYLSKLVDDKRQSGQLEKHRSLIAKIYLKLGQWHEGIHGATEETLPTIINYNNNAVMSCDAFYKAWHAYAYSNFQALLIQQVKLRQMRTKYINVVKKKREPQMETEDGAVEVPDSKDAEETEDGLADKLQSSLSLNKSADTDDLFNTTDDDILFRGVKQFQKWVNDYACEAVRGFIRSIEVGNNHSSVQDCLRLLTVWFNHGQKTAVNNVLSEGLKKIHVDTWLQMIPQLIARIDTPRSSVRSLVHEVISDIGKHHPQALLYPLTVAAKSSDT